MTCFLLQICSKRISYQNLPDLIKKNLQIFFRAVPEMLLAGRASSLAMIVEMISIPWVNPKVILI